MIQAVTFDVTHTLIHSPRLGETYAEILGRHGVEIDSEEARRLISVVWQELSCAADPGRDRFATHPEGERGWWLRFLERMCELRGAPPPSRFAAAELFHRFGTAEAWEVYPEVPAALTALARQGLRLGVVSNWDHRLPDLLAELGIGRFFGSIAYSAKAGAEKPDRRIFLQALEELGVEPKAALHVGEPRGRRGGGRGGHEGSPSHPQHGGRRPARSRRPAGARRGRAGRPGGPAVGRGCGRILTLLAGTIREPAS
jgi:putative hydrolase of the HAD superfamily